MADSKSTDKSDVKVLVGTRKGAFILTSNEERSTWKLSDPIFLGHIIYHFVEDSRPSGTMLMAAKTGHLGPTVFRSDDGGASWKESSRPPAFPKVPEGEKGRSVELVFWLTQGH